MQDSPAGEGPEVLVVQVVEICARFGNNPGQNRNMGNNGGNAGQNNFGNTGCGGVASGSTAGQPQSQLSPEEQTLLIAAQKAQVKQNNDPIVENFPTD